MPPPGYKTITVSAQAHAALQIMAKARHGSIADVIDTFLNIVRLKHRRDVQR